MTLRPASEWATGEPGIFLGVPDEEYFAGDEISNSFLKYFEHSPATAWASRHQDDEEQSDALRLGRAVHLRMADPAAFAASYVVAEECCAFKKDGGKCTNDGKVLSGGQWYCGVHGKGLVGDSVLVVAGEEMRWMTEWAARLGDPAAHAARGLLGLAAEHEVAIRWVDESTGLRCRAKFDWLAPSDRAALDYKTARDGSESEFTRAAERLRYYRQEAFYRDGAEAVGLELEDFRFVVLEKPKPGFPALTQVYRFEALAVEVGRLENRTLLDRVAGCRLMQTWPGFEMGSVTTIGLPSWRRIDTEMAAAAVEAAEASALLYEDTLPFED